MYSFIVFLQDRSCKPVHRGSGYSFCSMFKEAQRKQRPQALMENRLKPAALAQVEGVFRVAVSCFVFVVLFARLLYTFSFPGLVCFIFSFRHLFFFISIAVFLSFLVICLVR